ncbi:hypothetical protein EJ02DRAFT_455538 [Clathrospora elynae]|uniref:Uncharacterized protein n=1 Tax=Clathrospora elynae TaxID=706981 RepID=A0A6A5SQX9_9PLEO|nr:hypothetical protein EJ02DRAFT_455538 [Clathrospora elynae]
MFPNQAPQPLGKGQAITRAPPHGAPNPPAQPPPLQSKPKVYRITGPRRCEVKREKLQNIHRALGR